jgi:hypothetical protein
MKTGAIYRAIKNKVTLSHVYNEVTSEPTITRYTTIARKTLKVCLQLTQGSVSGRRRQGRPCCKMATPQQKAFCTCRILPWRRRPETLSRVNYQQTLRVFLTIVYRVIVGSLVTSLQTCESVTFSFNCPVQLKLQVRHNNTGLQEATSNAMIPTLHRLIPQTRNGNVTVVRICGHDP